METEWDNGGDEFCPVCGEEFYTGEPPVESSCRNPNCPECDFSSLEGNDEIYEEDQTD